MKNFFKNNIEIKKQVVDIEKRHKLIINRMFREIIKVEPYIGYFPDYIEENENLLNLEDLRDKYGKYWKKIGSILKDYLNRPGGKRLRPLLLLNSYEMFSTQKYSETILDAAVGLELLHEMALTLDDVMDDSRIRRGLPSLWMSLKKCTNNKKQKSEQAKKLTLELMPLVFSWARKLMIDDADSSVKPKLSENFWEIIKGMKMGQQKDLEFVRDKKWPSKKEILDYNYLKTGTYSIKLPLMYSLVISKQENFQDLTKAINNFSRGFGLAFQINDDLLFLKTSEQIGKDIQQDAFRGNKTSLVVSARELANSADRDFIEKTWGNPQRLTETSINQLRTIFKRSGALRNNIDLIRQNHEKAKMGLKQITDLGYNVRSLTFILDETLSIKIIKSINESRDIKSINPQKAQNRAFQFLETQQKNGHFTAQLSNTPDMAEPHDSPKEVASTLLVFGAVLQQRRDSGMFPQCLSYLKSQLDNGKYHFFEDPSLLPTDTETTSYGLSVLLSTGAIDQEKAEKTADKIVKTTDENGIIMVYFEPCDKQNQIDHVSATNVLALLNMLGRGNEAKKTEDFILNQLQSGKYLKGSRYYHSPDTFLYFLGRMIEQSPKMKDRFEEPLKKAVQSRVGMTETPIEIAMCCTTLSRLGENPTEINKLLRAQREDGGWDSNSIYHYGGKVGYFGSRAITTAFALEAIDQANKISSKK